MASSASLDSPEANDAEDAEEVYRLLEDEVVPLFYDRQADGIPRRWVALMRESIREVVTRFSARRMVMDYHRDLYGPLSERRDRALLRRRSAS